MSIHKEETQQKENDNEKDYLLVKDNKNELLIEQNTTSNHNHHSKKDSHSHNNEYSSSISESHSPKTVDSHKKNQDLAMRKLIYVSLICLIFMIIEVIGGYLANSIAIMSDAAHLLSDFLGFIISILSIYISRKTATNEMSFGFHRAEIIGALVSVTLIWGLTAWLLYEATLRLISLPEVDGLIMLIVAVIGFFFNLIMGLVLAYNGVGHTHLHGNSHSHAHNHEHGHEHDHEHETKEENLHLSHSSEKEEHHEVNNVNLRAALIHVVGDALQNLGVIIAGLIIFFFPHLNIADPICTYIFSIIVGFTTVRILKDCIGVLMEGSPLEIDLENLEVDLKEIVGVKEVHDLHVWSLSMGKLSLSCHLSSISPQVSLKKARRLIKVKYKITHSTIQVEDSSGKHAIDCKHDLHQ